MKGCMKNPTGQQVSRNDRNNVYVFRVIWGDRACILRMDFGAPMTPDAQRELRKVIMREPHKATALTDGWLCFKYLDNGEESISTFADISKGDIITYDRPHTPAPCTTPELCTHIRKQRKEATRTATLATRAEILDEPHVNQYIDRIRKASKAINTECPLKNIISVGLLLAAEHYERMHEESHRAAGEQE